MPQFLHDIAGPRVAALRERLGPRALGVALALLVEVLLVLAVLSIGLVGREPDRPAIALVSVTFPAPPSEQAKQAAAKAPATASAAQQRQPRQPSPQPPAETPATQPPPAIIPLSRSQMAALDIAHLPRTPSAPAAPVNAMMGPADSGAPGDSKRVGSAPNGAPLYAAAWYREPYDDELRGYLSTANGPGWALIACRTVADFRVEDCVGLDEYPSGMNLQRAVLAAAWQFRVRPPRLGGISKVGAWVRIRIDYEIRRQ